MEQDCAPKDWREVAEELFAHEFDNKKDFHEAYPEATSVYAELAKRVTKLSVAIDITPTNTLASSSSDVVRNTESSMSALLDMSAYKTMYNAHIRDTRKNNIIELLALVNRYEILRQE